MNLQLSMQISEFNGTRRTPTVCDCINLIVEDLFVRTPCFWDLSEDALLGTHKFTA